MPAKNNDTRLVEWKGRKLTIAEWAAETGLPDPTIRARLDRLKWAPEKALSTPINRRFSRSPGRPQKGAVRSPPRLLKHAGGQAFVRWSEGGKKSQRYFGPWGSARAQAGYAAFLRDWSGGVAAGKSPKAAAGSLPTVGDLAFAWLDHAKIKYTKLGKQTSAYHVCRSVAATLLERHEATAAANFGLVELEAVRAVWVANGRARKTVNDYTGRVVAMFGWGVPRKIVPADVHYALMQVEPLAPGATVAPEPAPVRSAPAEHIEALLAGDHLHPDPARRAVLAAMIRVQVLTGMRPAELCALAAPHLDRSGSEWKYAVPPIANKNFHREKPRPVWLGPRAQQILAPLLAAAGQGRVFAFAPRGKKATAPAPVSRAHFGRLVKAACERAGVPAWHPHQLRHNKATDVRALYESNEAARHAIGTTPDVAERIYTDPQEEVSRRIARETG